MKINVKVAFGKYLGRFGARLQVALRIKNMRVYPNPVKGVAIIELIEVPLNKFIEKATAIIKIAVAFLFLKVYLQ